MFSHRARLRPPSRLSTLLTVTALPCRSPTWGLRVAAVPRPLPPGWLVHADSCRRHAVPRRGRVSARVTPICGQVRRTQLSPSLNVRPASVLRACTALSDPCWCHNPRLPSVTPSPALKASAAKFKGAELARSCRRRDRPPTSTPPRSSQGLCYSRWEAWLLRAHDCCLTTLKRGLPGSGLVRGGSAHSKRRRHAVRAVQGPRRRGLRGELPGPRRASDAGRCQAHVAL